MSSWLSGGLSQFSSITGQISSFTKDVLSETTEEIEDPTAELQVARRKMQQLEEVNNHYKAEWEKLQKHSEEVRERAETAECQIAAISQEYRKLIQEKDAELRRLRTETASLKEHQRKMVSSGGGLEASTSPLSELARERTFFSDSVGGRGEWEVAQLEPVVMEGGGEEVGKEGEGGGGGGGWEEYHDFGDVISSQGEINRLQMELTRLKAESRHWRTLAEEKGHSTDSLTSGPMETELASLREQIEELQLCLQRERSQHQHQLSALEAAHQEKLRSFPSHDHTLEAVIDSRGRDGEEREEEVKVQLREAMGEGGGRRSESADETIRGSLLSALEEVSLEEVDGGVGRGERGGGSVVSPLQSQLVESREKCVKLESELQKTVSELNQLREGSREEVERERVMVETLTAKVDSLNSLVAVLQQERGEVETAKEREVETVKREVGRLEEENRQLRGGREAVERKLSEAQSTSRELRGRVERAMEEKAEAELRAKELADTLHTQKEVAGQLQSEVEHLKQQFLSERDAYTRHAEQEKAQLGSVVEELRSSISHHESVIAALRTQCGQSQRETEALSLQVDQLVAEMEGKNRQLEILQEEQISRQSDGREEGVVRESLQESNATILQLQESLRRTKAEMEESVRRVNAEKEECLRRVNEEKEESIRRVISEREEVLGQLTSSLETARIEKRELEASMEKEDRDIHGKVKQLETRLKGENEALVRAEFELKTVREELKASQEKGSQLDALLRERESSIAILQTEMRETREKMSQVVADHAAVEARLQEKEMVIEHSERNLREVGRLLTSRDEEITALQRERGEGSGVADGGEDGGTSGAMEAVSRERNELLGQVKTAQSEVQSLQSHLTQSRKALEDLNSKLQAVNARNVELERDIQVAQREAGAVRSERERLVVRMGEVEEEVMRTREELATKQTECGKLVKQLEHLRAHLVQVEEQYTQDALRAEERERGERKRAEELQETLRHSSYIDQQENLQTKARVAALEEQLHVVAGQRDAAILELSSAREEAESSASALHNLQSVLEQFQRDQSSELSEALKRSQLELANTLSELNTLRTTYTTAQGELNEVRATEALLYQQVQEREKKLEESQQQVSGLRASLHSTEEALERLMRDQGGRVDQNLVKNLVVGYVQAPNHKKPEVLNLIAKILDFSPSEVQQVQSRRTGGWLGGLWGRQVPPSPVTTSPKLPAQGASLSQLFVSFLETESLPSLPHHHHPPSAPPLHPPPTGRVPEPDPDRPSRATTGLALGHSSLPPSRHPSISSQSLSQAPHPSTLQPSTSQTSSSHSYTDTHSLPDPGTASRPPQLQPSPPLRNAPLSSLTANLNLSHIMQASSSPSPSISTTSTAQAPFATNKLSTSKPTPQLLSVQQTVSSPSLATRTGPPVRHPRTSPHQQSSILKDLLSPPTN